MCSLFERPWWSDLSRGAAFSLLTVCYYYFSLITEAVQFKHDKCMRKLALRKAFGLQTLTLGLNLKAMTVVQVDGGKASAVHL